MEKKKFQKLIDIVSNRQYPSVSESISEIFYNQNDLYLFLLGHKRVRKDLGILQEKLDSTLTEELQKYRQLLNPLKLSIMQLLSSNDKMPSVVIKNNLGLTWSDYYNSTNSLEKLELIEILEDFDDQGFKRQFVVVSEKGRTEYTRLIKLIDKFVERAKKLIPGYDNDFMYPQS